MSTYALSVKIKLFNHLNDEVTDLTTVRERVITDPLDSLPRKLILETINSVASSTSTELIILKAEITIYSINDPYYTKPLKTIYAALQPQHDRFRITESRN